MTDGDVQVLEFWAMWSILSLQLLPGLLWPGLIVPDKVKSLVYVELFNNLQKIITIIGYLKPYVCVTNNLHYMKILDK